MSACEVRRPFLRKPTPCSTPPPPSDSLRAAAVNGAVAPTDGATTGGPLHKGVPIERPIGGHGAARRCAGLEGAGRVAESLATRPSPRVEVSSFARGIRTNFRVAVQESVPSARGRRLLRPPPPIGPVRYPVHPTADRRLGTALCQGRRTARRLWRALIAVLVAAGTRSPRAPAVTHASPRNWRATRFRSSACVRPSP
jgi:hypothetical protein